MTDDTPKDAIEWQAMQEVILSHPDTLDANRRLLDIVQTLKQYQDGLLTSLEAVAQIHKISKS